RSLVAPDDLRAKLVDQSVICAGLDQVDEAQLVADPRRHGPESLLEARRAQRHPNPPAHLDRGQRQHDAKTGGQQTETTPGMHPGCAGRWSLLIHCRLILCACESRSGAASDARACSRGEPWSVPKGRSPSPDCAEESVGGAQEKLDFSSYPSNVR